MKPILIVTGLLLTGLLFFIDSQAAPKQTLCPPAKFLMPGVSASTDQNFDAADTYEVASLMVPAEYVAEHVPGYHAEINWLNNNTIKQPLYINIRTVPAKAFNIDPSAARALEELDISLYTDTPADEFSWNISRREGENFVPWGSCSDNFNGSRGCFRNLNVGEYWLTYKVEAENIAAYLQIDQFLITQVAAWSCNQERQVEN
ncbi:hypothetical protein [Rheinheimera sp.]|uniref:hypothetical protein n=1 Tax=Rheinheimera sp. TaxID=1869214 RepID=UPI004047C111